MNTFLYKCHIFLFFYSASEETSQIIRIGAIGMIVIWDKEGLDGM